MEFRSCDALAPSPAIVLTVNHHAPDAETLRVPQQARASTTW
jgi:hypothetical protein